METIFAQVVADTWRVIPDDVVISLADTAGIAIGFGTIASRTTVTLSAAIHGASERLRAKVFAIAANVLECAATDLELRQGGVGIVGVPGAELSLAKVAQRHAPAGITAVRQVSMPVLRNPSITNHQPSHGLMRCMRQS